MWTCPKCERKFRNTNQNHSCTLISKVELFAKRPALLKDLYNKIVTAVNKLGEYREESVLPDTTLFKMKSSFLGVKVKKDHLEVELFLIITKKIHQLQSGCKLPGIALHTW